MSIYDCVMAEFHSFKVTIFIMNYWPFKYLVPLAY